MRIGAEAVNPRLIQLKQGDILTYFRPVPTSRFVSERTTIRLPEELLARARRKAVAERRTLTSLIEEGLRLVIASKGKRSREKHNDPPVSEARGGLMAGLDWDDLSALEEAEELEYLRRIERSE